VKYLSLFFLAVGIVMVQSVQNQQQTLTNKPLEKGTASQTGGVAAVLLASITSAAAGIILEKIYKQRSSQTAPSLEFQSETFEHTVWTRNVQLSTISVPFALVGSCLQNRDLLTIGEVTKGFDFYVWGVVACQVIGGVVTAFVMKFANNLLKCLAISFSICCCAVYSVAKGDLPLSTPLLVGIFTVVVSVFLFSRK